MVGIQGLETGNDIKISDYGDWVVLLFLLGEQGTSILLV